jgi:4-coumarate--CoA ligase
MSYDPIAKVWSGPICPCIYNTEISLGYLILDLFTKTPERVTQINADDGRETTCAEMRSKSIKMAAFLASLGLRQHDVVGIVAKNSENLLPVVIGCLTLGLPINPLATIMIESDIVYMYGKTRPKVIFCDPEVLEIVKKAVQKIGLEKCEIFTFFEKVEEHRFVDDLIEGGSEKIEDFV